MNRIQEVLQLEPDLVLLLWDSDCSDNGEYGGEDSLWSFKETEVNDPKIGIAACKVHVKDIVRKLLAGDAKKGAKHVIVSGPALLGDEAPLIHKDKAKKHSNAYVKFNTEAVADLNNNEKETRVSYYDIRTPLLNSLKNKVVVPTPTRDGIQYYYTKDTEHFNDRGASFIAESLRKKSRFDLDCLQNNNVLFGELILISFFKSHCLQFLSTIHSQSSSCSLFFVFLLLIITSSVSLISTL